MAVIARFRVTQKAELEHYEKGNAWQVKLQGSKDPVFGKATPSANCEMLIVPDDAAAQLKVGRFYLVTFNEDPDQSALTYG